MPGYVLGFQEQVAGGLQGPGRQAAAGGQDDGPPLPLLHAGAGGSAARAAASAATSWPGAGRSTRTGASTPSGRRSSARATASTTRRRDGKAPEWTLTAMVMNHYKQPKRFYVRTRIWYTTEPRTQVYPVVGRRLPRTSVNGMAYDVPGGGKPGSTFVDRSTWTAPFSARILGGASHHHGGATHQTLSSVSVRAHAVRRQGLLRRAPTTRTTRSARSCTSPGRSPTARSARRRASRWRRGRCSSAPPCTPTSSCTSPRWASGSCSWSRDDTLTACAPMPTDLREVTVPAKYDQAAPFVYDRVVPQLRQADRALEAVHRRRGRDRRPAGSSRSG